MSDAHGHGDKPFLAHHFEDEDHQFDSGKLGIWAFLVTEILFFSGLFCAYVIYRAMHPEVFTFASNALDTQMGAINTGVLIFSSLTAAWAVRNAQLGQKTGLIVNLSITILCAFGFMGIKYLEYSHKFHLGLFPGDKYEAKEGAYGDESKGNANTVAFTSPDQEESSEESLPGVAYSLGDTQEAELAEAAEALEDHSGEAHADGTHADGTHADGHEPLAPWNDPNVPESTKRKLKVFFGIYFCMTGLHGIHVLIEILVLGWLLTRAIRGHFTPTYYGPIDFAALYWHLVDLIWIYLFPLLYLIN